MKLISNKIRESNKYGNILPNDNHVKLHDILMFLSLCPDMKKGVTIFVTPSCCASRWTRTNDPLINSQML